MRILGITGGSGSGKTTLLKAAEKLGFRCIDCDALYHELLQENKEQAKQIQRLKEENEFLAEASAFFAASRRKSQRT